MPPPCMKITHLTNEFIDTPNICKFLKTFNPKEDCIFYADDFFGYTKEVIDNICEIAQSNPSLNFIFKIPNPILPLTSKPKNLTIQISYEDAEDWFMIGTWKKLKDQKPKNFTKKFDHICCPTGTPNPARIYLILLLHNNNLWHDDHCSQPFTFTLDSLCSIPDYTRQMSAQKIKKIGSKKNEWKYRRFDHIDNLHILYPKHRESFISIVSETHADYPTAHITEKLFAPIIAKSIWIGHASPLWHTIIEKFYGFKLFNTVFSYDFDKHLSFTTRTHAIISQVKKLHELPYHKKQSIYNSVGDIIEYNYEHWKSGNWQKHVVNQWEEYQSKNLEVDFLQTEFNI